MPALTIINSGWLVLEQDSFKGTIKDFGGSDDLDLTKIRFIGQETTETFTQTSGAGGVLQVAQGTHVADLHLTGTYTTANFALASDGTHGTLVSFCPQCRAAGARARLGDIFRSDLTTRVGTARGAISAKLVPTRFSFTRDRRVNHMDHAHTLIPKTSWIAEVAAKRAMPSTHSETAYLHVVLWCPTLPSLQG